jgi:hypothetical protein
MRILLKVLIRWWWKMAEMSQRWDLNPGLSRKVRGLRWEFISLKLFFFFVETFFKKKKERKKVFKKKKKSFEIRWWWKMGRDEPEVRLESRVEQKSQRAEMRIHIFETFFFLLKLFSKKKKEKKKSFQKKKKVSRSGDDEKWAGMSQRWDLNPGLSRKVRGLRWEFISLKLSFFCWNFFQKKKKEKKKSFQKKKKSFEIRWWWKMGRDEPEVRLESRVEQKSQRAEMRIHIFETFFFFCWNFFQKKKRKKKSFQKKKKKFRDQVMMKNGQGWARGETWIQGWAEKSEGWDENSYLWNFFFFLLKLFSKKKKKEKKFSKKKKKSFEIRWWWKMGRDEPEVRLESRVEQKSQRAEMRIHIFETFFFLLKLFSKKKKRKEKKFSKKEKSFEIRWWWKMGRDEPEVRLESRVEQKSQRVEMRIHIFETFFFFVETFFKKKKKRKKVFKKKKSFEIRWWWKMGRDEPEVRFESRVEQEKSEGWDFQSCGDEKWQGWAREAGAEI